MEISKIGVIGAGQMGNGIAHVLALAGYEVLLNDISQRYAGRMTVVGSGTHPSVLRAAGVERADLVAGVTQDDEANLERWRWLPDDLGRRHVRVNIADYRLEARNDGRIERSEAERSLTEIAEGSFSQACP